MNRKTISIILAAFLLISANSQADTEQEDSALQIYLLREITIESSVPTLDQVAIIRGNKSIAAKASKIALGRISAPGQKIIVDRSIVLSRLASSGIAASEVTLTGAEKITITQQHQIIKGSEFIENALAFLKKNPPDASICQLTPIRIPKDLILSGAGNDIRLSPSLAKGGAKNQTKVRIAVFSNDKEIGVCEVTFRLKYNSHKLVAQVDIPSGAVISPENVKREKTVSNYPERDNGSVPYGFVAKRQLPANTVIHQNMIGPAKPQVLLKRNQNVVIIFDGPGLFVTATGKTMQEGRVGEYIKVKNVDSQRIIMAKVNEDGTVGPVF